MPLPPGISTGTVTFGQAVSLIGGGDTAMTIEIKPTHNVVHAATGIQLLDFAETVKLDEGVPGSITLPHTDQAGFIDAAGNAFSGWAYIATGNWRRGNETRTFTKRFQILTGQTSIDLDLLPNGSITVPVSAPVLPVTSFLGKTGAIEAEDLTDLGVGGGGVADGGVTTAKLATDAVTSDKIASGAVNGPELGQDAVTASKIANDAVARAKLAEEVRTELTGKLDKTEAAASYAPLSAVGVPDFDPTDIGHDIILVAGQSNAVGNGSGLDALYLDPSHPRVDQLPGAGSYYRKPVVAVEPITGPQPFGQRVGLSLTLSRLLAEKLPTNRRVLIVPAGWGSTGFSTSSIDPAPSGYKVAAGGSWDPAKGDGGISRYQFAIDQANAALALNPKNRIAGIVWLQGEADGTLMTGSQYQAKLDALIAGFRANIAGAANALFVVAQMSDAYFTQYAAEIAINAVHIDTPRRVQRTAFAYSPSTIADSSMVEPDLIHFSGAGQRTIGARVFDALLRAEKNVTGTAPAVPTGLTLSQQNTTVAAKVDQPAGRITNSLVEYKVGAGAWTALARGTSIDANAAITGRAAGEVVQVRWSWINEQGTSVPCTAVSLTMANVPGAASALTAPSVGATTAGLSWTGGSGATSHRIEKSAVGANVWTAAGTSTGTTGTATGLAQNTDYDLRVVPVNVAGDGPASNVVTIKTAPSTLVEDAGVAFWRSYSLRRVNPASTKAVQVRRSSDNALADVGFTSLGGLDTAALLAHVGSGDGFIQKWYDQSGNGRDLTQATAASQARIALAGVVDTLNGKPAAFFNGTSSVYIDIGAADLAEGASTSAAVFATNNATTAQALCAVAGTSTAARLIIMQLTAANKLNSAMQNDANSSVFSFTDTGAAIGTGGVQVTHVDTLSAIKAWLNGAGRINTTYSRSGHALSLTRYVLGGSSSFGAAGTFFSGYLSEIVHWKAALSTPQQTAGELNQKTFHGTA